MDGDKGKKPDWDSVPVVKEVDLTEISENDRLKLLTSHIDEDRARNIVQRIDGSAADYETNMKRIDQIVSYLHTGLGTALKIAAIV